jgi:uncharacterized protein YjbI with pentapeptide repeats
MRPDPSRRSRVGRGVLFGVLLVSIVVSYLLAIRFAPGLLDVGVQPTQEAQLSAEQNARVTVTSVGAALLLASGLIFTAFNYRLARRGQVAGQLATALTQLGSTELYVRVGAIHVLEPLLRASAAERMAVLDVLHSFVRHRAPLSSGTRDCAAYQAELPERPSPDIQAALTVLGQHGIRYGRPLDLHNLHLTRADLAAAHLDGADLREARLDGADLRGARLSTANLREANLRAADLTGAMLEGATLDGAVLVGANLQSTRLSDASLQEADLSRVNMDHAQGRSANLQAANLTSASLWAASLPGVNLVRANLDRADLRYAALEGANLYLASLLRADLKSADLFDANFVGANIWQAKIGDALRADFTAAVSKREAMPAKKVHLDAGRSTFKRLAICCDGTWGVAVDDQPITNVAKIARAVARSDKDGVEQITFHQRGRSSGKLAALQLDVLDAYRFLVQNFRPGDELYFFGFSRGAYLARTVVGVIASCGIMRREHAPRVADAYAFYRSRNSSRGPSGFPALDFRHTYSHETAVKFVGVWETVGPLGIPESWRHRIDPRWRRMMFHDIHLSSVVTGACQALAIDEHRRAMPPTLWQSGVHSQRLEQAWFPGAHSDVGGGYHDGELADASLRWMMSRAGEYGLTFRVTDLSPGNALGVLHNSLLASHLVTGRRLIRKIGVVDPPSEVISDTALYRHGSMNYQPENLLEYMSQRAKNTNSNTDLSSDNSPT